MPSWRNSVIQCSHRNDLGTRGEERRRLADSWDDAAAAGSHSPARPRTPPHPYIRTPGDGTNAPDFSACVPQGVEIIHNGVN